MCVCVCVCVEKAGLCFCFLLFVALHNPLGRNQYTVHSLTPSGEQAARPELHADAEPLCRSPPAAEREREREREKEGEREREGERYREPDTELSAALIGIQSHQCLDDIIIE